jgi:integrase
VEEARQEASGRKARPRPRFAEYAASLLERKAAGSDLKSAKSVERWSATLTQHLIPEFGEMFIDEIRRADIERWKAQLAAGMTRKVVHPNTANGWLAILRTIINAAVGEFELERHPMLGVKSFDTSLHPTHTEEQPNSLTAEEVRNFLAVFRSKVPKQFAMTLLGFVTGLRPSSLRALRRSGPTPDVLWDEGVILVRRSNPMKQVVMERTKSGARQRIGLPPEVMDVLRAHADSLPDGPMRDSDLLFPARNGGFRARSVLDKPFAMVAKEIGLKKHITPRAMRRTFQDLAREAQVKNVVTRAISGHATEAMQRHYSTVNPAEMREGIAQVVSLVGFRQAREGKADCADPPAKAV